MMSHLLSQLLSSLSKCQNSEINSISMLKQTRVRTLVLTPPRCTQLPALVPAITNIRNMIELTEKDPSQDLTRVIKVHDVISLKDIVIFRQMSNLTDEEKEKSEGNIF